MLLTQFAAMGLLFYNAAYEVHSNGAIVVANCVSNKSEAAHRVRSNSLLNDNAAYEVRSNSLLNDNAAHEVRSNGAILVANCVSDKSEAAHRVCINGFVATGLQK